MKRSNKQTADVLSALIAERQKYEQWIATLEARKASTPANVYARVHADYVTRLEGVMAELSARSAELQSQRGTLKSRSDELAAQESAFRDERAEADLRNDVGEFTPEQWKEVVRSSDENIAKVSAERKRIDAELEGLERVLSGSAPAADRAASGAPQEAPAAAASAAAPSAPTAPAGGAGRRSFDEIAFIQSVAPPATEAPATPAASPAAAARAGQTPMASMQSVGSPDRSKMAATPSASGAGTPPPASTTAPPPASSASPAQPAEPAPREPSKQDTTLQRQPGAPLRSSRQVNEFELGLAGIENLTEAVPGKNETPTFLKNVPSQEKTLKCGECGAMNYATEWYCERCGAELSAL